MYHSRSQPSVPPLNLRPSDVSFYDAHLEEHMAAVRAGEYGGHHSPMQKARARPPGPAATALSSAQARHISPTRQRGASSSNAYGSFWRPTAEDSKGRVTSWALSSAPRPEYRREKRSFAGVGLNHSASVVDEVVFGRDTDGSAAGRELDVRDNRYYSGAHGNTSKQLGLATNPLRVRSDHNPTVDRNASDVDVVVFGRDQDASGASGIPDDVTTTPMYAGASGTSSKVLGKGRWVGLRNTSDLAVPDASPPKPSRVQEMQYSSSEIALATGTSTESFRRKAYADGPSLPRAHKKFLTDAGLDTQASMVDDVVFGRNLDGASGVNDVRRSGAFRGASGRTSNEIHAFDNKSAAKRLVEAPWAASGRYESARNIFGAEYHIARRTGRLHD